MSMPAVVPSFPFRLAPVSTLSSQEGSSIRSGSKELMSTTKIILNNVLLVRTKTKAYIGKPIVTNAAVHAVVEEQGLDPKVFVFK